MQCSEQSEHIISDQNLLWSEEHLEEWKQYSEHEHIISDQNAHRSEEQQVQGKHCSAHGQAGGNVVLQVLRKIIGYYDKIRLANVESNI